MINPSSKTRDLTVERMLLEGGFNAKTFLAINAVLKGRMAGPAKGERTSAPGSIAAARGAVRP